MTELNSELAAERETLSHQALHDPLTGLPNRVLLYDRISQALLAAKRTTQPFAILAIDLDGFKAVNDTLGHDGGDVVLQLVADRLVKSVRESDTVARQGGDEFTVLLSRMAAAETAVEVARKLEVRLRRVLAYDGKTVSVGATIGVATFPRDGDDIHTLLCSADQAMHRRKREQDGRQPLMSVRTAASASRR